MEFHVQMTQREYVNRIYIADVMMEFKDMLERTPSCATSSLESLHQPLQQHR
jgi:hypothetical protein